MDKPTIAVLFGGASPEHDISLRSVTSILAHIDRERFTVITVGVTKDGAWRLYSGDESLILDGSCFAQHDALTPCALSPDRATHGLVLLPADAPASYVRIDAVLSVIHGTNGEDGTLQGLCALAGVPCVGSGVLGSAMCMDKPVTKIMLTAAGIDNTPWVAASRTEYEADPQAFTQRVRELGYPVFVKPADSGSSVGTGRARDEAALSACIEHALQFSDRVLVEAYIDAREVECAVYGNDDPVASCLGEIVPANEFYDYEAKYLSNDSKLLIPAPLPDDVTQHIRDTAVRAYQTMRCRGLCRVDFFVEKGTGRVLLNELNTLPGFTSISMYPKLMEHTYMSYRDLITGLIELAMSAQ